MAEEADSLAEIYGYKPLPIDLDRGVTRRTVKMDANDLPGAPVFMYRDMPGLYLGAKGQPVSDRVAKDAGFEVNRDKREAKVRAEVVRATDDIRARSAEIEDEIRGSLSDEVLSQLPPTRTAPVDVQMPDLDDGPLAGVEVTDKSPDGEPRGTKDFRMDHMGGPQWNVISRGDDSVKAERVKKPEAITVMLEAQKTVDVLSGGSSASAD